MNGLCSHASGYKFQVDKENVAEIWNPNETDPKLQGGFNYTNDKNVLRWLIRGDTICDVIIPEDAEIVAVENKNTPNGVWRTNKIIVTNPIVVTDEMCVELYKISSFPLKTYYQVLAIMAGKGFANVCELIIKDKINKDNIDDCIKEYKMFNFYKGEGIYDEILMQLQSAENNR